MPAWDSICFIIIIIIMLSLLRNKIFIDLKLLDKQVKRKNLINSTCTGLDSHLSNSIYTTKFSKNHDLWNDILFGLTRWIWGFDLLKFENHTHKNLFDCDFNWIDIIVLKIYSKEKH